jgi:hypothetical protein
MISRWNFCFSLVYPQWISKGEIKKEPSVNGSLVVGASREIRTPVLALKGLRPSPLDDGGIT